MSQSGDSYIVILSEQLNLSEQKQNNLQTSARCSYLYFFKLDNFSNRFNSIKLFTKRSPLLLWNSTRVCFSHTEVNISDMQTHCTWLQNKAILVSLFFMVVASQLNHQRSDWSIASPTRGSAVSEHRRNLKLLVLQILYQIYRKVFLVSGGKFVSISAHLCEDNHLSHKVNSRRTVFITYWKCVLTHIGFAKAVRCC